MKKKSICRTIIHRNYIWKIVLLLNAFLGFGANFAFCLGGFGIEGIKSGFDGEIVPFGLLTLLSGFCLLFVVNRFFNPSKSPFARYVLTQSPEGADMCALFDEIDQDLADTAETAKLRIGKRWMLGPRGLFGNVAIRIEGIVGVFIFYISKRQGYGIRVHDENFGYLLDGFYPEDAANSAFSLILEAAPPGILSGNHKAEKNYMALSEDALRSYHNGLKKRRREAAAAKDEREQQQRFRLEGSNILPTTRMDIDMLSDAVASLTGQDFLCLIPLTPIPCEKGVFTTLQCATIPDEPGRLFVECLFSNNGKISMCHVTADIAQTRLLFERLFTAEEIPNLKVFPDFEDVRL
jgi:hypothetical protein